MAQPRASTKAAAAADELTAAERDARRRWLSL